MRSLPVLFLIVAFACSAPSNQETATADSSDAGSSQQPDLSEVPAGGFRLSNPSVTHHYTGVIGGKYKFLMNLNFDEDSIRGQYRYFTQQAFLDVKGKIDQTTREFSAVESLFDYEKSKVETTGYFEGVQEGDSVKGTWWNADRKKTFGFVLATAEKEMPAFNIYDNGRIEEDRLTLDTIRIDFGNDTQYITGIESSVWNEVTPIQMEDLNFDGYLDLMVIEFTGARNTPYLFWLYDPASGKFIPHPELEATDPIIDVQHRQIVSQWSDSAISSGTDKYIFQDGRFFLVERSETNLELDKTTVTKYRIVDGKSIPL